MAFETDKRTSSPEGANALFGFGFTPSLAKMPGAAKSQPNATTASGRSMAGTGPASATGALELGFGAVLPFVGALGFDPALVAAEAPAEGAELAEVAAGVPAD